MDYWWGVERNSWAENYAGCLREAFRLKPYMPKPRLVIVGDFARFKSSTLHKTTRLGYYEAVPLLAHAQDHLGSENVAYIKWSRHAVYRIPPQHRALIPPERAILNDTDLDIGKQNVQRVFAKVANYSTRIDPLTHVGPGVAKSNRNAAHDGRVMLFPISSPQVGTVYERLVDNSVGDSLVFDIRVAFLLGHPVVAYVKFRPRERRFENFNTYAKLVTVADVLTPSEVDLCRRFCQEFGLEYGEIDILRDRASGRIYIVDAGNAPVGPTKALSADDRIAALRQIAIGFCRYVFRLAL